MNYQMEEIFMNYNSSSNKYKRNSYSKKTKRYITKPKKVCETVNYHKQQYINNLDIDHDDYNNKYNIIEIQYYHELERELYFRRKELFN